MPNPAVGVAAVGVASSASSASKGRSAAKKAASESAAASKAQLEFDREKYEDWLAIYGPIQDNLSKYYQSVTPEYYEARGLEAFQVEQQQAMERAEELFAQRGISDSGISMASNLDFLQEGATERARIRASAPSLAAEEQRSFLQVGLGQNPGESYSRSLAQDTMNKRQDTSTALAASQQSNQQLGKAVAGVGTALADYYESPYVGAARDVDDLVENSGLY